MLHVYTRAGNTDGTPTWDVWIGCAQPLLVWNPKDGGWLGAPMLDARDIAEACADAVAAKLVAKGYGPVCRCLGAPGSVSPCGAQL